MAEEVVVNIVVYAYPDASSDGVGDDDYLDVERDEKSITLRFRDGGVPFNQLEKDLPDTSHRDERSGSKIGI